MTLISYFSDNKSQISFASFVASIFNVLLENKPKILEKALDVDFMLLPTNEKIFTTKYIKTITTIKLISELFFLIFPSYIYHIKYISNTNISQ